MGRTRYLIIGGTGFLGRSISNSLRKSGNQVITTLRNKNKLSIPCIYLDLGKDVLSFTIPNCVEVAVFCAAISSIDQCRNNPEESRKVNVENTVSLISKLAQNGVSIIFPSSNLVFDGNIPHTKSDHPTNPCLEYGKQKEAVERSLLEIERNISIIRFSKILSPHTPIIRQWIEQLKNGGVIHPFSDMVLSPVPINFAIKAIIKIAESKTDGIWQVSAKQDITYEELARYIARKVGASERSIQPIKAWESGQNIEHIPKHTTLETSRIENELGLYPPDALDTIHLIID